MPSSASARYSWALSCPACWRWASRCSARSCSSDSSPNWIELVGQAWAQAGSLSSLQPVVAERALPHPAVVLALVDHPERAGRDAVAAAVADVLLDHHRAVLGAEQRPGGAHVEAGGVRAVLAHVGGHQPAEPVGLLVGLDSRVHRLAARGRLHQRGAVGHVHRELLLDERHVAPGVGAQLDRVVVGVTGEPLHRHRDLVPLLARHLARLAADAHRGVGEEAHAGLGALAVAARPRHGLELRARGTQSLTPALSRYSCTRRSRAGPRGRRPGRMSHVATLYSLM